jgi:hypothetical protein
LIAGKIERSSGHWCDVENSKYLGGGYIHAGVGKVIPPISDADEQASVSGWE